MSEEFVIRIGFIFLFVVIAAVLRCLFRYTPRGRQYAQPMNQQRREATRQQHYLHSCTTDSPHIEDGAAGRVVRVASRDQDVLAYRVYELQFPSANPHTSLQQQLSSRVLILAQPRPSIEQSNNGVTTPSDAHNPPPPFSTALEESYPVFPDQPKEELPPSYDDYVKTQSAGTIR